MMARRFLFGAIVSLALTNVVSAENETDRFFKQALEKARPELDAMFNCLDLATVKFALQTCERAETVVEAAVGSCHEAQEKYVVTAMKYADISHTAVVSGLAEGMASFRRRLLATVLRSRIETGRCQQNSN
jgi:hypothetical protein